MLKLLKQLNSERPNSKRLAIMLIDTETNNFLDIYQFDDMSFRVNNLKNITGCISAKIEIPRNNELYPIINEFYENAKNTFQGPEKRDNFLEDLRKRLGDNEADESYERQWRLFKRFKYNYPTFKNFYENNTITYCDDSFLEHKENTMRAYTSIKELPDSMVIESVYDKANLHDNHSVILNMNRGPYTPVLLNTVIDFWEKLNVYAKPVTNFYDELDKSIENKSTGNKSTGKTTQKTLDEHTI